MLQDYLDEAINLHNTFLNSNSAVSNIEKVIDLIKVCFKNKGKILIAGNGGSAADAQHFAAEIVCKFKKERAGYPAIALAVNSSIITAWGNDYNFDSIYSRQVEAFGQAGDIFIGISTSGNSKNIVDAVNKAKQLGIKTICLLGNGGGKLVNLADLSIVIPSTNTPRIQEMHILLIHIICEEVEKNL